MIEDGLKRARYSDVERRLWNDARFRALSPIPPCGQGLWLYLLTTPELGVLPGLIVMGESAMAEHLKWPLKAFREAFAEVFAKGMAEADWEARLVVLPKAIGRYRPQSPNVVTSWRQHWLDVPECPLKSKYYRLLKDFSEGLPEAFAKAFAKAIKDPSPNQIQEQEQEQEQDQDQSPEQERTTKTRLKAARGTRLPADWRPSSPDSYASVTAQFGISPEEVDAELEKFGDYWRGVSGQKGVKLDWEATFRNRLREQAGRGYIGGHFPKAASVPPKPLEPWFGVGRPEAKAT